MKRNERISYLGIKRRRFWDLLFIRGLGSPKAKEDEIQTNSSIMAGGKSFSAFEAALYYTQIQFYGSTRFCTNIILLT